MVDWSQFTPVDPGGATGAPAPQPTGGVDWSQFQPVDMPADTGARLQAGLPEAQAKQQYYDERRANVAQYTGGKQDRLDGPATVASQFDQFAPNATIDLTKEAQPVMAGGKGELNPVDQTLRDRVGGLIAGDAAFGSPRARAAEGLVGSTGIGRTPNLNFADFTRIPGTILAVDETVRDLAKGDTRAAAFDALGAIPGWGALRTSPSSILDPVAAGIGSVGRGIAATAAPVTSRIRGAISPDAEAARRVGGAIERDARAGGPMLNQGEFAAGEAVGQPLVNLERGGETTRALARSAANTSPEGRAALETAIGPRAEGQSERIGQFVDGMFPGGANAVRDVENLQTAARAANRPAYQAAYRAPTAQAVWDNELAQLSESPAMQAAIRDAIPRARNDAALRGFDQPINPFNVAEDGTVSLRVGPDGQTMVPNLQFWDSVQRSLRNMSESARGQRALEDASTFGQLRTRLNERLDALVPEFRQARAGAAAFFGAEDALEAGRNFVMSTAKNAEAAREIARFAPQERELFARGFAHDLIARVNEVGNNRNAVISKVFGSNASRERINMALGPQRAAQLEAFLRVENAMQQSTASIRGNSTTARQLIEAGLAGGAAGAYQGNLDPTAILTGVLLGGIARRGVQRVDERVARRVAEMLASNDPALFQRAVQSVARSTSMMNALRNIPDVATRVLPPLAQQAMQNQ